MKTRTSLFKSEQGQDLIEYTLLMAFVVLAAVAIFLGAGGSIKNIWPKMNKQLTAAEQVAKGQTPAAAPVVVMKPVESTAAIDPYCVAPYPETIYGLVAAMNHDMERASERLSTCGSFTDYFVPNMAKLIELGARGDVDRKIKQVIELADKGIFISSYEKELMKEGGTAAIREYIESALKDVKRK